MKFMIFALSLLMGTQAVALDFKKVFNEKSLKTLRYGASTSIGVYTPVEPDGDTDIATDLVIFNGIATMDFMRKGERLFADVSYQFFQNDAGEDVIGQEVGRYKGLVHWQKFMNVGGMKLWAGGGGGLVVETADSRHTVDSEGFLDEQLDARTSVDLTGVVSAQMPMFVFSAGVPIEFGLNTQLELGVSTMAPSFSFGATFLFK